MYYPIYQHGWRYSENLNTMIWKADTSRKDSKENKPKKTSEEVASVVSWIGNELTVDRSIDRENASFILYTTSVSCKHFGSLPGALELSFFCPSFGTWHLILKNWYLKIEDAIIEWPSESISENDPLLSVGVISWPFQVWAICIEIVGTFTSRSLNHVSSSILVDQKMKSDILSELKVTK